MPKFKYTAKTGPQTLVSGELDAETEQDAVTKLNQLGYFPIQISSENLSLIALQQGAHYLRKVPRKDLVLFTRQLATLIESGVNILNALKIISDQLPNKYLKAIIIDISSKIKEGMSFSESLNAFPTLFPGLYIAMIRTGESSGNLNETLKRLADFLEKEEEFKNSVISALTYPVFVFSVGALTVIVLLTFVIPRLITMFQDMGQMLPLPTQILINLSTFLREYWWLLAGGIAISIFLFNRMKRNLQGKTAIDKLKLAIPLLGDIALKSEISHLVRTLSLLLSSGVPIVSSLETSSASLDNQIMKNELEKFKEQIAQGFSFSQCLKESSLFPSFIINIVTVGEETGTMEKALLRIADDYEREIDAKLKTLTRLLEPIIILIMGLIVGFIVIAMLLPIFQINLIVQ
ncbi:MAG: type II secretion system F family protein [Candidatus Omnitrophica bacterium]|nr:type II secretion system F family protein [Candidatus Omnitrophota bacterium]